MFTRKDDPITATRYKLRIFFSLAVLAAIVLLLARFVFLPDANWKSTSASIVDELVAALFAAVVITIVLRILTSPEVETAEMQVVQPTSIREVLDFAHFGSYEWWYRGHLGRHCRTVSIPRLAKDARQSNRSIQVKIDILDPRCDRTCDFYASYRQKVRSANSDQPWNRGRVRSELLATIVAAYAWKSKEPLLDLSIALHRNVSLFRIDISSRLLLITKEDEREPALRCDAGTFFYYSYLEELRMSRQQSDLLPSSATIAHKPKLDAKNVRQLLNDLGLVNLRLSEELLVEIVKRAEDGANPYG